MMRCLGLLTAMVMFGRVTGAIAETVTSIYPPLQGWQFEAAQGSLQLQTHNLAQPKYFVLREPDRIVVDVLDTSWTAGTVIQPYVGNVSQIRIAQFTDGVTRFVLDWAGQTPPLADLQFQSFPQADGSVLWRLNLNGNPATNPMAFSPSGNPSNLTGGNAAIAPVSMPTPTANRFNLPQGFPPALMPPPAKTSVTIAPPPKAK